MVKREHREAALTAMHPNVHHLTWWAHKWIEEDTDPDDGMIRRVAQAIADAEQRGRDSRPQERIAEGGAGCPFEKLLSYYCEGQSIELTVDANGSRRVETPDGYAFADDVRTAAQILCDQLTEAE